MEFVMVDRLVFCFRERVRKTTQEFWVVEALDRFGDPVWLPMESVELELSSNRVTVHDLQILLMRVCHDAGFTRVVPDGIEVEPAGRRYAEVSVNGRR